MTIAAAQLGWSRELSPGYFWPDTVGAGGVLGLFAPAGGYDPDELKRGVAVLHSLGFEVKIPKKLGLRHHYLAGRIQHRFDIIKELMEDPGVDGLMAVRGGFGCQHLLPRLAECWSEWPSKPVFGFSDLTALHLARLRATGVVGYHAPMVSSLGKSDPTLQADSLSLGELKGTLTGGGYCGRWSVSSRDILKSGEACGPLLGGNLTLVCSLLASPWLPGFAGSILMLEEVDEPPYRLDRLLTTLQQSPLWFLAGGLVFGRMTRCGPVSEINRLLKEVAVNFNGPVIRNAPFGHLSRNRVFPVGATGFIKAEGELV